MKQEETPWTWQSIMSLVLIWTLVIGGLGYAFHYKLENPDRYAEDIEHR